MGSATVKSTEDEKRDVKNYVADEETREFIYEVMRRSDETVNVVPKDLAKKILTEKRIEIIETVQEEEVESINDLARKLDRDPSIVTRDLELLKRYGIIDFKKEGNRKVPVRTAEKVVVEPI